MSKRIIYLSLTLSSLSALFSFMSINITVISKSDMISIIGVIISSFAFMLGAYFIVLAVDAYSHLKDIKQVKDDINLKLEEVTVIKDNLRSETNQVIQESKSMLGEMGKIIDELMTTQIDLYNMKIIDYSNNAAAKQLVSIQKGRLYQFRARFAINNSHISDELLKNRLMDIQSFGDNTDLKYLSQIIAMNKGSEFNYLAESAIKSIQQK